jgi:hypothetical protein
VTQKIISFLKDFIVQRWPGLYAWACFKLSPNARTLKSGGFLVLRVFLTYNFTSYIASCIVKLNTASWNLFCIQLQFCSTLPWRRLLYYLLSQSWRIHCMLKLYCWTTFNIKFLIKKYSWRRTYGMKISIALLMNCLPTKMIASWMQSSARQPPWHCNQQIPHQPR